jgi:drug/metabolite transporter (DMT)-like permease
MAAAVLDYFIYGEKLTKHHIVGMIFIIASALSISLAPNKAKEPELVSAPI